MCVLMSALAAVMSGQLSRCRGGAAPLHHTFAVWWLVHVGCMCHADFAHMTDKDVIEMCKAMNSRALNQQGYRIGALKAKRVRALAHWARDLRNRQLPIDDNGFDVAALDNAMIMLDTDNATDETDVKKPQS